MDGLGCVGGTVDVGCAASWAFCVYYVAIAGVSSVHDGMAIGDTANETAASLLHVNWTIDVVVSTSYVSIAADFVQAISVNPIHNI